MKNTTATSASLSSLPLRNKLGVPVETQSVSCVSSLPSEELLSQLGPPSRAWSRPGLSRGLTHLCICRSGWRTSVATTLGHPGFAGHKDRSRAWCRLAPPCTGPGPPESHRRWLAPHPAAGSTPWTAGCPLSCRPGGTAPRLHGQGNTAAAPTEGGPWLQKREGSLPLSTPSLSLAFFLSSTLELLSVHLVFDFWFWAGLCVCVSIFALHSISLLFKNYPQNRRTHAWARVHMHMHSLFYVIQTTKTNLIPLEAPLTTRFNEGGTSHHFPPVKSGFV